MSEDKVQKPTELDVPIAGEENNKRELKSQVTWSCELKPRDQKVTVGTLMDLHCAGESATVLNKEKIEIKFEDKNFDYALKVLGKQNIEADYIDLVVTSYKAGNFENPIFVITDGDNGIKIENLSWQVNSVLKSQQEKPEPSKGPFQLNMPWWYWSSIFGVIFVVLLLVFIKLKKIWDRKKLIEELSTHATALTPFNQFNKDLRSEIKNWQQLELTVVPKKEEEWRRHLLVSVEKYFRQYLMRELLIPTLDWTDAQIIKEIKKRHSKIYSEAIIDIKKILREIRQAQKATSKIAYVDCEQILNMTRVVTEKIYEVKQGQKK
ncbi:MAG: hypothetical protein KDD58_04710 [Bdellovibrionales bacterium]|nr:hypothetical protein [Bdellovibrionales bacterium]